MGLILGKFRKKKSTIEILERLDTEIRAIEEFRRSTEQTHKKIVGRFILTSVLVYLLTAFIFYFYFFPASMYDRLLYVVPLLSAPLIIISVKKVLTWYYNRKLNKNHDKLVKLREEKKKMLDRVMDTETYKVAKSILEKFAPEQVRRTTTYNESTSTPSKALTPAPTLAASLAQNQTGLRYRSFAQPLGPTTASSLTGKQWSGPMATPLPSRPMLPPPTSILMKAQSAQPPTSMNQQPRLSGYPSTPAILPRAVLPRDRSVFDKMVDYLVGDGPSNRYALICKHCSSHNGMALKEEFEYLSFRCCYCAAFNPAKKQRPAAPKLEYEMKTPPKERSSDTSESERISSTDTDSEIDNKALEPITTIGDTLDLKLSDTDKLSDIDHNCSDNDYPPMEIDSSSSHSETAKQDIEEIIEAVKKDEVQSVPSDVQEITPVIPEEKKQLD